jgi:pyridoxamine 5'-phosphate oxidase
MNRRVYRRIWECLNRATGRGRSPFSMMQAATVGLDGSPQVRTIVLRRSNEAAGSVSFVTDLRSAKVAELGGDPRISLVGCDFGANIQMRLKGKALIHAEGAEKQAAWSTLRDRTVILFRAPLPPGTPIRSPSEGHVQATGALPEGDDGYQNFCLVDVSLTYLEWLDLSAPGHERVSFCRNDGPWVGSWIAP